MSDAAPASTTARDAEAGETRGGRGDGGTRARGKDATATRRRMYDERDVKGKLSFFVSLWIACVSRVTPQIALAGAVGAGRAVVETVGVRRVGAVLDDVSVRV